MDYINPVLRKAQNNLNRVSERVEKRVISQQPKIRKLIKDRWLRGLRPDGSIVGYYRSVEYANEKYARNNLAGFDQVDLTLTGKLGDGIFISGLDRTEVEIYSRDQKYLDISKRYGDDNFNITEDQTKEVNDTATFEALTDIFNDIYQ